eukprot:6026319-Prymnesium_polylepis.1
MVLAPRDPPGTRTLARTKVFAQPLLVVRASSQNLARLLERRKPGRPGFRSNCVVKFVPDFLNAESLIGRDF